MRNFEMLGGFELGGHVRCGSQSTQESQNEDRPSRANLSEQSSTIKFARCFPSCMCEHQRHKTAISHAHTVNIASTVGSRRGHSCSILPTNSEINTLHSFGRENARFTA